MALPKMLRRPIKWLYCAVIVAIGFAGRAHLSRWHEDWSEVLPPHQVDRYVALVRQKDPSTLEKLLSFAQSDNRSMQNTAQYLLDRGGALDRLDRATRVEYWFRRLGSSQFAIYESYDPEAANADFEFRTRRELFGQLWQHRDLAVPIALRETVYPGQLDEVLHLRWSTQWLYTANRSKCTEAIMDHLGVLAASIRIDAGNNRQAQRLMELTSAVPLCSWLVTYTAHNPSDARPDSPARAVAQSSALEQWWEGHASLSQDQREALALEAVLSHDPPQGQQLLYAQYLLNRPLQDIEPDRWQQLREQGATWSRLQWACDGFRQAGFKVEPGWDGGDVEQLLRVLDTAAAASADGSHDGFLASNALWLLERLASEPPPPWPHSWLGPLIGYPWADPQEHAIQAARWNDWWQQQRAAPLRDPTEPIW